LAGYVRQSSADIVPTAIVRAAPINNEYNALRDAFAQATGHKHDGTAAEGAYVSLISDTNARNKVVVDGTNNRLGFFVSVSSAAAEQVRLAQNVLNPLTDNVFSLGTSPLKFKDLFLAGTATIASVVAAAATISSGTINNTTIGATTAADGTFVNLTVSTAATIASAAISAGTINNTTIGATTASTVRGTTITATTGFVGDLTGAVTGNTSGTHTGAVSGNVTGNLTGNVTATVGSSSFNDVVINGTLDMTSGSAGTITGLSTPSNNSDAATKGYVDTSISNLVASAPGALDTLNELAAALGNDASFSTTVTNSIATKLALAGGTMSGAIAMGSNKITGLDAPTANADAATKGYVDTADALKLNLSGGTMSGSIAMGTSKITGLGDPTNAQDATTKTYVDGILGSATAAATSAAAAATSASNAATSASNASTSATNASASATAAAASYDSFDDRYLGPKASDPTLDNDNNALLTGALYFNTTSSEMRVYSGSAWLAAYLPATGYLTLSGGTLTGSLLFTDNTYDIGASGATRPRNIFLSNNATIGGAITVTSDSTFSSTGALKISVGTTGERPGSSAVGMLRYNTTTNQFEGYSGSSPAWNSVGGATVSNDISTSTNVYPIFANATSGSATTIYTSDAKLLYKPSAGDLQSTVVTASNGIFINNLTVAASYTIAAGYSGHSAGPITIASGQSVTVSSGSRWVVL